MAAKDKGSDQPSPCLVCTHYRKVTYREGAGQCANWKDVWLTPEGVEIMRGNLMSNMPNHWPTLYPPDRVKVCPAHHGRKK